MFVPVACSACAKPFQVPEAAIGKPTACPWCRADVLALPVAGATSTDAHPDANSRPVPEPLSLDDDHPPASRGPRRRWLIVATILLVGLAATLATLGVLRRKEGYLTSREWRSFTPPDASCTVHLLGRPAEDAIAPESGMRRYVSEGWYSGTITWLGWRNLSAVEAQIAAAPEAWHNPQLMKLFDQERDWLKGKFCGYVTKDATIQIKDPLMREVRLQLPEGQAVERQIVVHTGPRPRLYFLGIAGKRLDPEGAEVKRLFESFHVLD